MEKHEFALYVPNLSGTSKQKSGEIVISEQEIVHRIKNVLRLNVEHKLILFDRQCHVIGYIKEIAKNIIRIMIKENNYNKRLQPAIVIGLPLLKKEAFEDALYSCVELGASKVIPYISSKSHRKKLSLKEQERAEKIIQSAAEQAKYYNFPLLLPLQNFDELLHFKGQKVFFDADGLQPSTIIEELKREEDIFLLVGPEGDLTMQEKEQLNEHGFRFCALTPTILRAKQAVGISLGLFRSMFS